MGRGGENAEAEAPTLPTAPSWMMQPLLLILLLFALLMVMPTC